MGTDFDPMVGHWYQRLDSDQRFEVLALDEDAGTVDVQYFDGDVEQMDIDVWYGLDLEAIEAPDDWEETAAGGDLPEDLPNDLREEAPTKGPSRSRRKTKTDDWDDEAGEETEESDDWEDDEREPWRRDEY